MIIMISFTKRLLIKLGQSFILSDKPLDKLYVGASLFFFSESRSVTCARQHHVAICSSSHWASCTFFVITMVAYPCRCVMGSQVSRRPSCRILPNEICKSTWSLLFLHQPGCKNPHRLQNQHIKVDIMSCRNLTMNRRRRFLSLFFPARCLGLLA
jgi:hypothetical protein